MKNRFYPFVFVLLFVLAQAHAIAQNRVPPPPPPPPPPPQHDVKTNQVELPPPPPKDELRKNNNVGTGPADTSSASTPEDGPPEFPGGQTALLDYLKRNVRYPKYELEQHIEGTVYVIFDIEKTGKVSDPRIFQHSDGLENLEQAAMDAILAMPAWKPGRTNGMIAKTSIKIPVSFVIRDRVPPAEEKKGN